MWRLLNVVTFIVGLVIVNLVPTIEKKNDIMRYLAVYSKIRQPKQSRRGFIGRVPLFSVTSKYFFLYKLMLSFTNIMDFT